MFFYTYGLIPAQVTQFAAGTALQSTLLPFITAIFLHGSWVHILGNMLYLWIFGDNIEDRMGHLNYLLLLSFAGIIGSIAHILSAPRFRNSDYRSQWCYRWYTRGLFSLYFPEARILTLVPVFFLITFIRIPAIIFLPIWFGIQLLNGLSTAGMAAEAVAWWAHIGGFIGGAVLLPFFKRQRSSTKITSFLV